MQTTTLLTTLKPDLPPTMMSESDRVLFVLT